jgi:hypothetical protein
MSWLACHLPWRRLAAAAALTATALGTAACAISVAPGSKGPPPEVQTFTVSDASHTAGPVRYPQDPPVGGPHAPSWASCGFYSNPIPNEMGVHSLEHGAAWITFRPDLPPSQVNVLRSLARDPGGRGYVLVSPYPPLTADTAVVASAWGKQMRLKSFDESALRNFIRTFAGGPQTPEPGAPCAGGGIQPG